MIIRKCDQCGHTYPDGIVGAGETHYSLHRVTIIAYQAADLCSTECLRKYLAENLNIGQLPLSFTEGPAR